MGLALVPFQLHDHPKALTLGCYLLSCAVIFFTDRFALPKRERRKNASPYGRNQDTVDILARLPVVALVFAGFFAISWRPLYAAAGTMSFFIIFTGISRAKFKFIREPLVFSDIALVADVFKYKSIFYATSLNIVFWIVAFLYVFGVSGLYMYFEPSVLPTRDKLFWIVLMVLAASAPWISLFYGPVNRPTAALVQRLVGKVNVKMSTVRFGTFGSVVFHFIIWLGVKREKIVAELSERLLAAVHDLIGHEEAPLVVVWQSESFIDMRHFGVDTIKLPTIDRLRKHAVQWGRLSNIFEGGYTLRTEFAVLSGLLPDDIHVDASYPYLRASHYADVVWPGKMKRAGWHTHFIHPYDRTFFLRHKAMPLLGFEKLTMLDAFDHDPARDGLYVSDAALTERVVAEARRLPLEESGFLFVASMANHGPWEPGRVGELANPVDIYLAILEQSDAALKHLIDSLEKFDRPVWLAFYGDHAPLLKSFADPFPDPRTDYFIVPLAKAKPAKHRPGPPQDEDPWNLLRALLQHANLHKDALQ
ncbi:LTA synthase family protein [Sinorhizobium alkalisoli]|uniref:Capsular biosynthesis protein n=1 Tax=Sinorhizobium alkalisoli TaxID=1752398 RepID=A0A1E3V877_9HYPH|nr:LTA synthase family protein [Sinorhizobium alkalisoli]MCA1489310.1 LTA synthase family protein [Ensifer sp. NBAIM29]MCG5477574.1 LTA synthase family protein [Sinorhizobium alkalisoli]ODR89843.1 capsular biosynthesis protein [Sinorhizobium alkalisoli]